VTPLVLKRRAEPSDNPDWLFELKYDGFRALLEIDGAGARFPCAASQMCDTPHERNAMTLGMRLPLL
jgi:hypothetical protein